MNLTCSIRSEIDTKHRGDHLARMGASLSRDTSRHSTVASTASFSWMRPSPLITLSTVLYVLRQRHLGGNPTDDLKSQPSRGFDWLNWALI